MVSADSGVDTAPSPSSNEPESFALDRAGAALRHKQREQKRALARRVRQGATAVAVVAVLGLAALALRPQPVPVDLATARHGPLSLVIEENGVSRVKDRFVVSAPVTGSLSRSSLEAGDEIREGDVLAELAPLSSPLLDQRTHAEAEGRLDASSAALGQAKSQVARATVASEQATQELERTRRLYERGALASQALEQAEFALRMREEELSSAVFAQKIAKEELRMARAALGRDATAAGRERHVEVLAPVSGRVLRVHQKSASVVQAGAPLVEVGNPRALELVVDLLTTDAVKVTIGTPASIGGWGGEPLSGKVSRVEPSGFTRASALGVDEQRVNIIVALTDPPERWTTLGDGYRVEAKLVLWQSDNVLQVPGGAVFRRGQGWAVFRVRDGVAQLVDVQIGHRGERAIEIVSGLAAGDSVAVHPGDRMKDGARVTENRP